MTDTLFEMNDKGDVLFLHADMREALKALPENSVDSVVTDPPYHLQSIVKRFSNTSETDNTKTSERVRNRVDGYARLAGTGFMGARWDGGDIAFRVDTWREVLRVLKPGGHLAAFGGTRTFHRMACAIEDSGFEIRDTLMWVYGCVDEETEALTKRGWLRHCDLRNDDEVMQWDSVTGDLSWARPLAINRAPYAGPMVRLVNRHTDQLVTPNHRVYAKIRRHARNAAPIHFEVVEAGDLKRHWQITLPTAGVLYDGAFGPTPDDAYLLGWWLTDAWPHKEGKACMFSQCKPVTLARLRAALALHIPSEYVRKGRKSTHADEHTFYVTGAIADWLLSEYPDRSLNWDVLSWPLASRKALFNGLMDGDGSVREGSNYAAVFWSKKAERRAVFMALAASLGFRAFEDAKKGCVHFNTETATTQVQYIHRVEPVHYEGTVWCVTVPKGAFVCRRRGGVFITGNSGFPKSHDVSKGIDKSAGAEREVVGPPRYSRGKTEQRYSETRKVSFDCDPQPVTAPATDAAKEWQGWGTSLKPAVEPVILARKPLSEKTVAANVLRWRTGAINIDGCRVEPRDRTEYGLKESNRSQGTVYGNPSEYADFDNSKGRWPANLLIDGSDEVVALFPTSSVTGKRSDKSKEKNVEGTNWLLSNHKSKEYPGDSGSAARFFFNASTESDREWLAQNLPDELANDAALFSNLDGNRVASVLRNAVARTTGLSAGISGDCQELSTSVTLKELKKICETVIGMILNLNGKYSLESLPRKLSQSDSLVSIAAIQNQIDIITITISLLKSNGCAVNATLDTTQPYSEPGAAGCASRFHYAAKASKADRAGSRHPTVKPISLMRWLTRLITPPGGLVLDPFAGSGTTGAAALEEGMRCLLIEREAEYADDIRRRLSISDIGLI